MYHIQEFKQKYLIVDLRSNKAVAMFHHFDDAKKLLKILNNHKKRC